MGPVGGRDASVATQTISEMTNNNLLLLCLPQSKASYQKEWQQKQQARVFVGLSLTLGVQVHSVLNWLNN